MINYPSYSTTKPSLLSFEVMLSQHDAVSAYYRMIGSVFRTNESLKNEPIAITDDMKLVVVVSLYLTHTINIMIWLLVRLISSSLILCRDF